MYGSDYVKIHINVKKLKFPNTDYERIKMELKSYEFKKEDCWYKDVCTLMDTTDCRCDCLRYLEMFHLMNLAKIPKKKQYPKILRPEKIDHESFKELSKIKENIFEIVQNGDNIHIFSERSGNGKTTWALKLMHKYFDCVWSGNELRCRGLFVHTPTLLNKIKENISNPSKDFHSFKLMLETVDLVIWDDVVVSTLKEFDYNNILGLIDTRIFSKLSNIYTGNLTGEQILRTLGERIYSRINVEPKYKIELKGSDRRGAES